MSVTRRDIELVMETLGRSGGAKSTLKIIRKSGVTGGSKAGRMGQAEGKSGVRRIDTKSMTTIPLKLSDIGLSAGKAD